MFTEAPYFLASPSQSSNAVQIYFSRMTDSYLLLIAGLKACEVFVLPAAKIFKDYFLVYIQPTFFFCPKMRYIKERKQFQALDYSESIHAASGKNAFSI